MGTTRYEWLPAVTSARSLTTELAWESVIDLQTRRLNFRICLLMRLFVNSRFEARMTTSRELADHVGVEAASLSDGFSRSRSSGGSGGDEPASHRNWQRPSERAPANRSRQTDRIIPTSKTLLQAARS
jgi:hypothetical protein